MSSATYPAHLSIAAPLVTPAIIGPKGCYRQELRCIAGGSGMRNCSGRESQPPVADPEEVDAEIRFLLAALERV
jgi:hypothetical protein